MAKNIWRGDATAIAQVNTWTFAGTWLTTETITVTINDETVVMVTGSATIATFLAAIQLALAASTIPEFQEVLWTNPSGTTILGTAATAGIPFTATFSTNSASGTIDGGTSTTGAATVPSAGPADWSTAANWTTGSEPANGDDVYFTNSANPVMYGLNQSAVTLNSLNVDMSYSPSTGGAGIGLPRTNGTGTSAYLEYRPTELAISWGTCTIGTGTGSGCGRIKLNSGTVQGVLNVLNTGQPIETGLRTVQWRGTNASNVVNASKGSVAAATFPTDTATIVTLNLAWQSQQAGDVDFFSGPGCTLTTINKTGGAAEFNSSFTTLNQGPGAVGDTVLTAGTPGTVICTGGRVLWRGAGNYTQATVGATGIVDFREGAGVVTGTNTTLKAGASFYDPGKRITFTNPIAITCSLTDLAALDLGNTFDLQRS